jgi:hypothetical protein
MDGRALTSTELAYIARVAPQTTSGHLAKLTRASTGAFISEKLKARTGKRLNNIFSRISYSDILS